MGYRRMAPRAESRRVSRWCGSGRACAGRGRGRRGRTEPDREGEGGIDAGLVEVRGGCVLAGWLVVHWSEFVNVGYR